MNQNITKIIDQYLLGELSPEDKTAFELRMNENEALQQEVKFQSEILEGVKRSGQRLEVQQAGKGYHFQKLLKWGGGISLSSVIIAGGVYLTMVSGATAPKTQVVSQESLQIMEESSSFDALETQYFQVPKEGDYILSEKGVLISVPKEAFLLDGKPYKGEAVVQFQEILSAADIVKSGLTTHADNNLLETQGMIDLKGFTPEGKRLDVNPDVGVYIQIPVDEYKDNMQLFEGHIDTNGLMNWTNPTKLEKIPTSVNMSKLDFYPKGYEPELNELKWSKKKRKRDSLYLSFENDLYVDARNPNNLSRPIENETNGGPVIATPLIEARFTGGYKAMKKYIESNFRYPEKALESEEYGRVYVSFTVNSNGSLSKLKIEQSVCESLDAEAIRLVQEMPDWTPAFQNGFNVSSRVSIPIDFKLLDNGKTAAKTNRNILRYGFGSNNNLQTDTISEDSALSTEVAVADSCAYENGILPSSVLGFWNKKFNNTNLATREFEERMRVIHETCSPRVLKLYTSQLNNSISDIDQQVVNMGHPEFQRFVNQGIGKVKKSNAHIKNLDKFYTTTVAKLKKKSAAARRTEIRKQTDWDKEIAKERLNEKSRESVRKSQNLSDETALNMKKTFKDVGRQIPLSTSSSSQIASSSTNYSPTRQLTASVGFTIRSNRTSTWNVDRFTTVMTARRKSATFVSRKNGKKTSLTYNDLAFTVENGEKYTKLYTYLFPNKINGFQRIIATKGKFNYTLNNDMEYDLIVVGMKDGEFFYFERRRLNKGNFGSISLTSLNEKELDKRINGLNKKRLNASSSKMNSELAWLFNEKKDYNEQKLRKEMSAFRNQLRPVIYPCGSQDEIKEEIIKLEIFDDNEQPLGVSE